MGLIPFATTLLAYNHFFSDNQSIVVSATSTGLNSFKEVLHIIELYGPSLHKVLSLQWY